MKIQHEIINDFIREEFKKERYQDYKSEQIFVREEASPLYSLEVYEFAYQYKESPNIWPLDSARIQKLKNQLQKTASNSWRTSKPESLDYKVISIGDFKGFINPKKYSVSDYNDPASKLVIQLSQPILLDKNHALLYYEAVTIYLLPAPLYRYAVLLKKVEGNWIATNKYYNGIYY